MKGLRMCLVKFGIVNKLSTFFYNPTFSLVKEIENDNDDVPNKENTSECSKDRYEYEEGSKEVTGNKETEQAKTEIAVYECNATAQIDACIITVLVQTLVTLRNHIDIYATRVLTGL